MEACTGLSSGTSAEIGNAIYLLREEDRRET